ncbi:hypothetical protein HY991_05085 [Candidatus Micrarchaeota archaeon]|nr:hypothetical protein [Candidatus Micrarchaeota archaeon]
MVNYVVLNCFFKRVTPTPEKEFPTYCPLVGKDCIGSQCDFHPQNPRNGFFKNCPITDILESPYTYKK